MTLVNFAQDNIRIDSPFWKVPKLENTLRVDCTLYLYAKFMPNFKPKIALDVHRYKD